ncbi:unnamed protein product [Parajaminaea phylloscopi]
MHLSSFVVAATLLRLLGVAAAGAPDVFEIKVPHLDPEDAVWDHQRGLLYQSNLYRARISVSDAKGHKFDVNIPGVSSDEAKTPYELAGLSLDNPAHPKRLYGVAKDHGAFTFSHQSVRGPNRFIAFDLPITPSSKPVWQVDLNDVQASFEEKTGHWPFAPVDSAQDAQGQSYVIFALGAPYIAQVTPKGALSTFSTDTITEVIPRRVGYTGIAYLSKFDKLVTFGGPRLLTAFDLTSDDPNKPLPIRVKGPPLPKWSHAEKINVVRSLKGDEEFLVATNAPDVYSFRSTDRWQSVEYRKYTRPELRSNSMTTATDLVFGKERHVYAAGAYFGNGKFSKRTSWPLYKVADYLIDWSLPVPKDQAAAAAAEVSEMKAGPGQDASADAGVGVDTDADADCDDETTSATAASVKTPTLKMSRVIKPLDRPE